MKKLTKYHYDGDITFEEGIILTNNLSVKGNLVVMGDIACEGGQYNINACNITAYNINAYNITARDINACNITALNINACNITALNINALNINSLNINALNISYYAVCFAYQSFKCKSVKGTRDNSKHFCLDGEIEFINDEKEKIVELSNGSKVSESTIREALKFVAEHKEND